MASPAARFDMVPFEVSISGLNDPSLRVLSFSGQERVSQTFDYTIDLVSQDDGLALEDLVGKPCTLQINTVDGEPQRWLHGVVANFQQAESSERVTVYRARVVPPLHLLSFRQDCRIFQDMSVPDIISKVFDDARMSDYTLRLNGSYPPRVYCVQYRESDLNFVARLMEDEGMFYFFDHTEDKTVLTLIDDASTHPSLPFGDTLEHHSTGGGLAPNDFVFGMRWQESITTNAVAMRDFDFKKPSVDHMHLDKEVDQCVTLEQYDYPGIYEEPGLGTNRVCTRLDALQANRQQVTASTTVRRVLAGYRFTLTEHPNGRFNREYIVTAASHNGRSPQALEQDQGGAAPSYSAQFSAVPSATVLRPLSTARRPRMDGVQTAIVVGPAGEEIYTDEFGRVKVQFHWDRVGGYNEKSSCWVRVSQLWAGAGWGGMDIPRIGHEVIVSFEEGDPDRPMITGRVYHGENRPPHSLPVDKVKSTIRSNSTPGGGGFNELTFDDTKGAEEVFLHSQLNTRILTLNDKSQDTGHDEALNIGNNRTKSVGTDETTTVGNNRTEEVGADEQITIGANRSEQVGADETIAIGANRHETVESNETITVGADRNEEVGGDERVSIGGDQTIHVGSKLNIDAGTEIVLRTGASSITMQENGTIVIEGKNISVVGSGLIKVRADKDVVLKGKKILSN